MDPKPGWKTSEFWASIGFTLVALAVTVGLISANDAETVNGAITSAVEALFGFVASMGVLIQYVRSRLQLKRDAQLGRIYPMARPGP